MITETMPKSIFAPRSDDQPELSNEERIENEVLHLRGHGKAWNKRRYIAFLRTVLIWALSAAILLFFAEPFIYAYKKEQAIRSYLYLKQYGSPAQVQLIESSPIFTDRDLRTLKTISGDFQSLFSTPKSAQETAAGVIAYSKTLDDVAQGNLTDANLFTRFRYNIFNQWGLVPPVQWRMLNPDPRSYGVEPTGTTPFRSDPNNIYRTHKSEAWRMR